MWQIGLLVLIAGGVIWGCTVKSRGNNTEKDSTKVNSGSDNPNDSIIPSFSKEDLIRKLIHLSMSPVPENLQQGAMCYSAMREPDSVSYICPQCSEKTLYTISDKDFYQISNIVRYNIHSCRSMAEKIKGLDLRIDEKQFCKKCSPDVVSPQLCLYTHIHGEEDTIKVSSISADDLEILQEFLSGKLIHSGDRDEQTPLKNYIPQIERMLGIKIKN
ncbi:MAG: hypothetical protein A2281_02025 [Bacteroidetes bacterium RIFOXYA12_FULL_38_20]|nr:MAG: hypothetical protein A2281_02025 [Bacteroidetes bacterium RIFOXYA12_FULL_38_20]